MISYLRPLLLPRRNSRSGEVCGHEDAEIHGWRDRGSELTPDDSQRNDPMFVMSDVDTFVREARTSS